jgi:hypothetical protein
MTRWCLPVLYILNNELRIIADRADEELLNASMEGERKRLEEAANIISKSFTYCITDRGVLATSKKFGTYCMIGILFRIYFKVSVMHQCGSIILIFSIAEATKLV